MQKDDPATIASLRHRNALRHKGWSQLSPTISDIGLRGLTLLCREHFVTSLKFCHVGSPRFSLDLYKITILGPGVSRSDRSNWDTVGCSLIERH